MKTPQFWYRPPDSLPSFAEQVLTPLSCVYRFFHVLHQHSKIAYVPEIPVLCLGNLVAGGTGKTPAALAILRMVKERGFARNPFFLSRGYGGAETGPLLVDMKQHTAWDVGDEPLILCQHAPTVVAADRAEGAKFARIKGADLIIMDDGLQNPGIHKNLKLVVINGEMGFGNMKLLPAGPLRQPLAQGIQSADGFILIGKDTRGIAGLLPAEKPLIHAAIRPSKDHAPPDPARRYLAFAGLGYPEKFFTFLQQTVGLNVVKTVKFADHYPYEKIDLLTLNQMARELDADLITTEKDFIRLPAAEGIMVNVVGVEMVFENPGIPAALIENTVKKP